MNRHDMNQKERMLKALPYIADMDGLDSERLECKKNCMSLIICILMV